MLTSHLIKLLLFIVHSISLVHNIKTHNAHILLEIVN